MSLITYVPAAGYDATEKGVINIGGGSSFDVGAALVAGSGQFTVDSVVNPALVNALDSDPGLQRSGVTPGPVIVTYPSGPVIAAQGPAASNDILARDPSSGLFTPRTKLPDSATPVSVATVSAVYAAGQILNGSVIQNGAKVDAAAKGFQINLNADGSLASFSFNGVTL